MSYFRRQEIRNRVTKRNNGVCGCDGHLFTANTVYKPHLEDIKRVKETQEGEEEEEGRAENSERPNTPSREMHRFRK